LILGSVTWFTSVVWAQDNLGLFFLATTYAVGFGFAGYKFYWLNQWNIPSVVGGIFGFIAVCTVPVAVFGLQRYYDHWSDNCPGVYQASSLALAAALGVGLIPWPFITAPLYWAWFFIVEVDVAPWLFGESPLDVTPEQRGWVSVSFGAGIVLSGLVIDKLKFKQDYGFWAYFFGDLAVEGGLTGLYFLVYNGSDEYKLVYLVVSLINAALAYPLDRYFFAVLGGFGASIAVIDFLVTEATIEENSWVSVVFGGVLIGLAWIVQQKAPSQSFPWYGYIVGVISFWSGWTTLFAYSIYPSQYFKFLYFLVNVGLLVASVYTKQRVFLIFGSLGVLEYVYVLAYIDFWNSWWLPLILTALGLTFIGLAIYFSSTGFFARKKAVEAVAVEKSVDVETPVSIYQMSTSDAPQAPFVMMAYPGVQQQMYMPMKVVDAGIQ